MNSIAWLDRLPYSSCLILFLCLLMFVGQSARAQGQPPEGQTGRDRSAVAPGHTKVQTEKPRVTVQCSLLNDLSACTVVCAVENVGTVAANKVALGFAGFLPAQTQISADTDTGIELKRSDTLPIPDPSGAFDRGMRAFSVQIPAVPPKTKLFFTLWTDSEDNRKACQQLARIRQMQREIITAIFAEALETRAAVSTQLPEIDSVLRAIAKVECLFHPYRITVPEQGRWAVNFTTPAETQILKKLNLVYSKVDSKVRGTVTEECMAPVFSVEQSDGSPLTFNLFPSYSNWYAEGPRIILDPEVLKLLKPGPFTIPLRPVPPQSYSCRPRSE